MRRPSPSRTLTALALVAVAATGCASGSKAAPAPSQQAETVSGDTIAGTAAEDWASGEAGLGEPPTAPPPGWDQALLDEAITTAKAQLVAANLNDLVAFEQETAPYLETLHPDTRPDVEPLIADAQTGYKFLTRFAPGVSSDGDVRVSGRWRVSEEDQEGSPVMRLMWEGTYIYPVTDGGTAGNSTVVPLYRTVTWSYFRGADEPGLNVFLSGGWNADECATFESGLITPDFATKDLDTALEYVSGGEGESGFGVSKQETPEPPDC